jgi:hypothetical protein
MNSCPQAAKVRLSWAAAGSVVAARAEAIANATVVGVDMVVSFLRERPSALGCQEQSAMQLTR